MIVPRKPHLRLVPPPPDDEPQAEPAAARIVPLRPVPPAPDDDPPRGAA